MLTRVIIGTCVTLLTLALIGGCSYPEKPALRGDGPLAVQISSDNLVIPEYHNPMEVWKPRHMQAIQKGEYTERECMSCHTAETSCNNCHQYVGVPQVSHYAPGGAMPGEDRTMHAVNGSTP